MPVNANNGVFGCFGKSAPARRLDDEEVLKTQGKDSSNRAVKVLAILAGVAAVVALVALAIILIPAAAPIVAAVSGAILAVTTLAVPSFVYPVFFGALSAILGLAAFLVSRRQPEDPNANALEKNRPTLRPLGEQEALTV